MLASPASAQVSRQGAVPGLYQWNDCCSDCGRRAGCRHPSPHFSATRRLHLRKSLVQQGFPLDAHGGCAGVAVPIVSGLAAAMRQPSGRRAQRSPSPPLLCFRPTSHPQLLSKAVVVAVLLMCATGVTKLMKTSQDLAATVKWRTSLISSQVCLQPVPTRRGSTAPSSQHAPLLLECSTLTLAPTHRPPTPLVLAPQTCRLQLPWPPTVRRSHQASMTTFSSTAGCPAQGPTVLHSWRASAALAGHSEWCKMAASSHPCRHCQQMANRGMR